ncbi:hypothetical protein GGI04_002572 [Coemansia thaxteri]|nr:hypothetical protein GGI04_002572 [Coemansia thaxteri]KAJ2470189.1 hypothetical protein GGI02_003090 [Coemansia sp. RSA 2322]
MSTPRQLAKLALFSGSTAATGSIIAQYFASKTGRATSSGFDSSQAHGINEPVSGFDRLQVLRFFAYGVAFAPITYRWHVFLNAKFPVNALASKPLAHGAASRLHLSDNARAVLKRTVVDQTVFAPLGTGAFVVGMGVLEGQRFSEISERLRVQYPTILLAGYVLWPAAQLINFSLVPLVYRVPFSNVVGLFWNTYLGWSSNRMKREQLLREATRLGSADPAIATV